MLNVAGLVTQIVSNFFTGIALFLPQFFAGLLILLVGLLVASVLKHIVTGFFKLIKFDTFAKDSKLFPNVDVNVWPELFGELLRWTILILFIVAAVDTWGVKKVGDFLNQLLIYLPNVFIAVVMGLVGIVVGNLVADVVRHGSKSMGSQSTGSLSSLARYAIYIFTGLLVLHQLGVAADLIQILFTGVVAMIAIAGGLAFGLGGQDTARDILRSLREKLEK